jgi:hypothetical protein
VSHSVSVPPGFAGSSVWHILKQSCNAVVIKASHCFRPFLIGESEGGIVSKIFPKLNSLLVAVHFEVQ